MALILHGLIRQTSRCERTGSFEESRTTRDSHWHRPKTGLEIWSSPLNLLSAECRPTLPSKVAHDDTKYYV